MTDAAQRAAMRAWPTHEVHGDPGFVTCRRGIIEALLDELEEAERREDVKSQALRHLAATMDTLSPQEVINVCAAALGRERWDFRGAVDPNRSLVEMAREHADLVQRGHASALRINELETALAAANLRYINQRMECDSHAGPLLERAEAAEAKLAEALRTDPVRSTAEKMDLHQQTHDDGND